MNRQKVILSVLLVIFAGSLVYSFLRMPRQEKVDKLTYTAQTPVPVKRPAGGAAKVPPPTSPDRPKPDDRRLRLDLLDSTHSKFSGFRRNIFQPIFKEEEKQVQLPLPAAPVRSALPKPPPPPPPPPIQPPPQVVEPTPVQQEMARFTFLGFLKKDNKKTIFLSSNNEIFLVKKGDKISGKYEVSNITDEALSINVLPDGGEIVIPLVENKPLSAPRR